GVGQLTFEIQDLDGFDGLAGAERVEVEAFDGFDLVTKEIDADRHADLFAGFGELAGKVDVDNASADGEIAGDFDLVEAVVAVLGEPDDEFFGLELLGGLEGARELG